MNRNRRHLLRAAGALAFASAFPRLGLAGPFDSIQIDPGTKILKQATVVVPAAAGGTDGVIGSEIVIAGRGYFGVDFVVQGQKELTLLLVTQSQRNAMAAGRPLSGDPLVRIPIDGTASHTTRLTSGRYHMFFLNSDSSPTQVIYRTSLQAF